MGLDIWHLNKFSYFPSVTFPENANAFEDDLNERSTDHHNLLKLIFSHSLKSYSKLWKTTNIAGRLPEKSRKSFVDQQSTKTVKITLFIEG